MKIDLILNLLILVLGLIIAIAPWTFAPVCVIEMRCWFTRDVETLLGALVAVLGFVGMYRSLGE
ncbi:MAG: hypothetical protein BAJATHORv1_20049 [Candidatus Thorarchaeota archaeon]|nr:MAG: hypothetical protein BAJATHORv1_20049 [Candidatus Thorarchaeota archaeon]